MENSSFWGPLEFLIGKWQGDKGQDIAPDDDRGTETNLFREEMIFEQISPVRNHEQVLYGLRYSTKVWRIGESEPMHEDLGYWLWDPQEEQLTKTFVIPRGISVIAGATVKADAKKFTLKSKENCGTYGLCHNIFLEREFKITDFELSLEYRGQNSFYYEQNTRLKIKGRANLFDHRDHNTLIRV